MPVIRITQTVQVTVEKAWSRGEVEYLAADLRESGGLLEVVMDDMEREPWDAMLVELKTTRVSQVDHAQPPSRRWITVELDGTEEASTL